VIEVSPEPVEGWVALMQEMLDATLLGGATELRSWFMGANVEGKTHAPLFYFGGAAAYFDEIDKSLASDFAELEYARAQELAKA